MGSPRFSSEYAVIADVPITLTIDPRTLTLPRSTKKTFRSPDEIFTYDDKLERTIVEKYEKQRAKSTLSVSSLTSKSPNELQRMETNNDNMKKIIDTMQSVSIDTESSKPVESTTFASPATTSPSPPLTLSNIPPTRSKSSNPTSELEQPNLNRSGIEMANLYLPDDTQERRERFAEIYTQTRSLPTIPTDIEVLRAYFMFDGDVEKATNHLKCYIAIKELGFPEDDISAAVLLYNNNQEEALEHLIRGGPIDPK